MPPRFHWITFDVGGGCRRGGNKTSARQPRPRTSGPAAHAGLVREAPEVLGIPRGHVHANQVQQRLPWLYQSYRGAFLALASATRTEPVMAAGDDRYGIVLNVQRGPTMRFECHVDSNPLTGLLFCRTMSRRRTGHRARRGRGGPRRRGAGLFGHPTAGGHLIFFDARRHPHYARPLTADADMRVVAVMNYYTESYPESTRPRELNKHLYGDGD